MQGIRVAMKSSCQCPKPRDGFSFDCIIFTKKTFVPDCKFLNPHCSLDFEKIEPKGLDILDVELPIPPPGP